MSDDKLSVGEWIAAAFIGLYFFLVEFFNKQKNDN